MSIGGYGTSLPSDLILLIPQTLGRPDSIIPDLIFYDGEGRRRIVESKTMSLTPTLYHTPRKWNGHVPASHRESEIPMGYEMHTLGSTRSWTPRPRSCAPAPFHDGSSPLRL